METSPNVTWQDGRLSRRQRWHALASSGATVWLTGLPASGKSTIGAALEERLVASRRFAYLLDGDNLRHGICGDLGFTAADRIQNTLRAAQLAQLFADAGAIAIVALISPYETGRRAIRELHESNGLRFLEVHVDTPLEVCSARDPKGLYARARAGELQNMTGVDDPYEPPGQPDLRLSHALPVAAAVDAVLAALDTSGKSSGGPEATRAPRQLGQKPRAASRL